LAGAPQVLTPKWSQEVAFQPRLAPGQQLSPLVANGADGVESGPMAPP